MLMAESGDPHLGIKNPDSKFNQNEGYVYNILSQKLSFGAITVITPNSSLYVFMFIFRNDWPMCKWQNLRRDKYLHFFHGNIWMSYFEISKLNLWRKLIIWALHYSLYLKLNHSPETVYNISFRNFIYDIGLPGLIRNPLAQTEHFLHTELPPQTPKTLLSLKLRNRKRYMKT